MNRKVELVCSVCLAVLGIFAVMHGLSLPLMGPVAASPGLFPTILGCLLTVLSGGFLFYRATRATQPATANGQTERQSGQIDAEDSTYPAGQKTNNLLIVVGLLVAYSLLLPVIHFIPASLAFGFALTSYALRKVTIVATMVVIVAVFIINYTFTLLFRVVLP